MIDFPGMTELTQATASKIVLMVLDGLGGLPDPKTGKSELETAKTPALDELAWQSSLGLLEPVLPGITPGSGPGHLALFGYDPVKYQIGRGIMEALGIGAEVRQGDIAARGNFCTVDEGGIIVDRRAGRINSEEAAELCNGLDDITMSEAEVSVLPVKEYRLAVVFRGEGLAEPVSDSDPQRVGSKPLKITARAPSGKKLASVAEEFVEKARGKLRLRTHANMLLLRGFSGPPSLPQMSVVYNLRPAAIAAYPMYRGLAKLVGMKVLATGSTFASEVKTLAQHYQDHDFFYIHYKATDSAGEDGDFARKVRALEDFDALLPEVISLKPEVLIITGDHSSPAMLAAHSWHPVPVLLHSAWCRRDGVRGFSERACAQGSLGKMPSSHLMLLALANALKLTKFGA